LRTIAAHHVVGVLGARVCFGKDASFPDAKSLRAIELANVAGLKVSGACGVACLVSVSDHGQVDCMLFGHFCFLAGRTPLPSHAILTGTVSPKQHKPLGSSCEHP